MIDARNARPQGSGSAGCRHRGFTRVGIQRAPLPPYRLYLLTCRDCGTTLTTQTIRNRRDESDANEEPSAPLEEDTAGARKRRLAG
jgi:hypothetical protein